MQPFGAAVDVRAKLVEKVLQGELAAAHLLLEALGLVLRDGGRGLLDQAQDLGEEHRQVDLDLGLVEVAVAEALAERRAHELVQQKELYRQQQELLDAYHDREEDARSKYDDFEQVAYNPRLPVSDVMAQTIQASEIGPEIAYYLGSNPKEADRIFRMTALMQAKEIGKIESKLADNPPVKKSTSAPAPISPVTAASSSSSAAYDTTDPRSIKTMSTSEWIESERQRQIRKYEAQRNR